MNNKKLLVADDEAQHMKGYFKAMESLGWLVEYVSEGNEILSTIGRIKPDAVLLDLHFPEDTLSSGDLTTGWKLQGEIIRSYPGTAVILLTKTLDDPSVRFNGSPTADLIFRKSDLFALFRENVNGVPLAQKLSSVLNKAIEIAKGRKSPVDYRESLGFVVGKTEEMQGIAKRITDIAKTNDFTVLILGESGTGKEMAAQAIHKNSSRKDRIFVTLECPTIPNTLFESTLFGQRRGVATNISTMKGRFEEAAGGTIFLDEIGDIPLECQPKILGVIERKTFRPIGAANDITIDIRIIAATNRNLNQEISKGGFRSDLYERLNQTSLILPPLRQRLEDIPELCDVFLEQICQELGWTKKSIRPEAIEKLKKYEWPRNIRQLKNVLRQAILKAGEHINDIFEGHISLDSDTPRTEEKMNLLPDASIPQSLPYNQNDMILSYLVMVKSQSPGERYETVKEIPNDMIKDFLKALFEDLQKQQNKRLRQKDIAEYLCGDAEKTTYAKVRRFLSDNNFHMKDR